MARRRKSNLEEGVNLDSLMDALTNVVAVLILVLILVQADVSKKVVDFLEGLEPATSEQVEASKKEVEILVKRVAELDQLLQKDAPTQVEIEVEKRQLALLEKDVKERKDLLVELEGLKKAAKEAQEERDVEAQKTEKIQDRIAELEGLLDETPVLKIEPTIVGIPASRPIPNNASIYRAIVIHNRIHFIDPITPLELFKAEFKKAKIDFPNQRIKRRGSDRYIYQAPPILKHFKGFDFKNSRGQKHELTASPTSTRLHIRVSPNLKNGGTSLEELGEPRSDFGRILDKLRFNRRAVLIFNVHPNSFNTYLRARQLADREKVTAGWEVNGSSNFVIRINDIEIERQQEPTPAKPGPERPPNLPTKID